MAKRRRGKGEGSVKCQDKWKRIIQAFQYRCLYCDVKREKKSLDPNACLTLDRFIPTSDGGRTYFWNCIPACKTCNDRKCALSFDEFIEITGLSREEIQSRWIEAMVKLLPDLFEKRRRGYWHPKRKAWHDNIEKEFMAVIEGLKKK